MTTQDSNNPVDSARELRRKRVRDLQLLKDDKGNYVLSTFTSPYAVTAFLDYIDSELASKLEEIGARVLGPNVRVMEESDSDFMQGFLAGENHTKEQQRRRLATEIERLKQ